MQAKRSSLLLAIYLTTAVGCASFMARSGIPLNDLAHRDQVYRSLGTPVAVEKTDLGEVAHYKTRRKLSDPFLGWAYGMEFVMFFGLTEPLNFSRETLVNIRNVLLGQHVDIEYDEAGQIVDVNKRETLLDQYPIRSGISKITGQD